MFCINVYYTSDLFQNDKVCKKESTYCAIFVMAQCHLSLGLADRFTHGHQYSREIVCDNSTNENGKDTKTAG